MDTETGGTGRTGGWGGRRRWAVMLLAGALSLGAVGAWGDRGFLAAVVLLTGGALLTRRRRATGAAVREDRMTTDPWQGDATPAVEAPVAKRRRGTRSIQKLG